MQICHTEFYVIRKFISMICQSIFLLKKILITIKCNSLLKKVMSPSISTRTQSQVKFGGALRTPHSEITVSNVRLFSSPLRSELLVEPHEIIVPETPQQKSHTRFLSRILRMLTAANILINKSHNRFLVKILRILTST